MGNRVWAGLKAIIPLALTVTIVVWLINGIEAFFGAILKWIIPSKYYYPGYGFFFGIIVIFCVGYATNRWFSKHVTALGEKILARIPLVKTLYNSITDLMSFFDAGQAKEKGHVVAVEFAGVRLIGMLTQDNFSQLPQGIAGEDQVAVFLPMSYQIGGYTVLVPKSMVEPINWSVEAMMSWVVTGGMKGKGKKIEPPKA